MATGIDRLGRRAQATRAQPFTSTEIGLSRPILFATVQYRKTPLISTYVISGLAMVQVLIFGAVLTFRGYDKAEAKILQGRSRFNLVFSADNALLCMFQQLWTHFQDIGVLIFGGYVLSGHCGRQHISVKNEGVLIFGGVLIYGVLRYFIQIPSVMFGFSETAGICLSFLSQKNGNIIGQILRNSRKCAKT